MENESEYRLKPDNELEDLRRRLRAEGSELAANIGRRALYHRAGVEAFEVIVTGVQRIWDEDDEGNYRFGVEGYTVRRAEDRWVDDDHRAYPVYAASVREIEFLS